MPATKYPQALRSFDVLSVTATVAVGAEPNLYRAVNLDGAVGTDAQGVVINSRPGSVTICLNGLAPVALAAGQTLVKGDKLTPNASGYLVKVATTERPIAIAMETVTSSVLGDYIQAYIK